MSLKKMVWAVRKWWSDVTGTRQYFRYLEKEDRRRRLAGQFATFLTIALGIQYLYWHAQHINWDIWYLSFFFFLAELNGLLLFSFFSVNAWFLRYHASEGIAIERDFSVDIFIPVAGEDVDLLRKTIEAAVRIDFPNKKIYILDDKGNEAYKKLAEINGCGYFARKDHSDAKAGNLNFAFHRTEGDLILALDADQVPHPEIIKALIGYFKVPKIAFVQSKQNFKVPVGDPFGNSDQIFYNVMQSGKDNDNAAFSCGSGVMYLREALNEIGGFSTWNIVEDVHTSMLLHDRGWRSIYYNYSLTKGTSPADIIGVYRQRKQWAADSLRILFWDNPFFHKMLSPKQKLQYFHLGYVYLVAAFIMPFFFITPILALLTEQFVLISPVSTYVIHRFPYFIAMSLAYGILNYPTPYMKAFQMWTGLFPAFIQATWIALRSRNRKPSYRVNVKQAGKTNTVHSLVAVLPQMSIIALGFYAMIYIFITGVTSWDFYLLNGIWISWALWTMSGICLAAIKKHRWPEEAMLEETKSPSFFSQTKELIATLTVSIIILMFFTMIDATKIDQFGGNLRIKILSLTNVLEKPLSPADKVLSKTYNVPETIVKANQPSAHAPAALSAAPVAVSPINRYSENDEDINKFLRKWARSWQSRNMKTYRGCYTEDFQSNGMNLNDWIKYETAALKHYKRINVEIININSLSSDYSTIAIFTRQTGPSGRKSEGTKILELKKVGDEWKIFNEEWGSFIGA
jgi:cellulose synthase (UDP-forming)